MPEKLALEDVAKKLVLMQNPDEIMELLRAYCVPRADAEALAEALQTVPPYRLFILANWIDTKDDTGNDEVQRDLRRMADRANAALANYRSNNNDND